MSELASITVVGALAAISPGPDFALLARNALGGSRREGYLTALGISLGVLVHVTYTILGIAVLVERAPSAFKGLQLFGCAYLVYTGCTGVLSQQGGAIRSGDSSGVDAWRAFSSGFLCNALNPKTMVFFLSVFAMLLPVDATWVKRAAYGVEVSVLHLLWFCLLTALINFPVVKQRLHTAQHWVNRLLSLVLIGLGIRLIVFVMIA